RALELLQVPGQALGDRHAARVDADEAEVRDALVALHDLVSDALQRPLHLGGAHEGRLEGQVGVVYGRVRHVLSFPASRDRLKGSSECTAPGEGAYRVGGTDALSAAWRRCRRPRPR